MSASTKFCLTAVLIYAMHCTHQLVVLQFSLDMLRLQHKSDATIELEPLDPPKLRRLDPPEPAVKQGFRL